MSSTPLGMDTQKAGLLRQGLDLFVVSFLLLFFELAVIRWVPASVRVVAYFSNVVLVSCFLGIGLGCIYGGRRRLLPLFPWLALVLLVLCRHLGEHGVENPRSAIEYVFIGTTDQRYPWLLVIPLIFLVNALAFIPLGQKLSEAMRDFRPLQAYSINIAGSLVGTIVFALYSFLDLAPGFWFATSFLLVLFLLRASRRAAVWSTLPSAAGLALVLVQQAPFLWSPYYKISVNRLQLPSPDCYLVTVNDDYHQAILDLSDTAARSVGSLRAWQLCYDVPYRFIRPGRPFDVLVLGAGTGNDVAAALRNGASHVDAVELDRKIIDIGRGLHPERPYSDPRVRISVTDARAYVESCRTRYDLIVLGWLDSHRLFSSLSNVRQDNFVYSVESSRKMRSLLKEDGVMVLSFFAGQPWIGSKIHSMLSLTFGREPLVFALASGGYGRAGAIFVASTGALTHPNLGGDFISLTDLFKRTVDAPPPTDNWPYLYYRNRGLSREYLLNILVLLGISVVTVAPSLRQGGVSHREALHFFALGAGFLLLEVRNITILALVFGSTWVVTSVVISAILVTILFANYLVARDVGVGRPRLVWLLLFSSVLLSLGWSWLGSGIASRPLRQLLTTTVVSLTFVFAGVIFARSFSQTRAVGAALGYNLLGAVVGGVSEYASLLVGIDGLSFVALLFYLLAWQARPQAAPPVPQEAATG